MAPHFFFRRACCALVALTLTLALLGAGAARAATVLVSGEVSVDSTGTTVNLTSTFVNPIVIAFPATRNGSAEPAVPRVSSVTPTSFFVRLQEPTNLDGVHPAETVSYIVVEQGTHTLESGRKLAAGFTTLSGSGLTSTLLGTTFPAVPLLLAQVQTLNDPTFVHVRVDRVRANATNAASNDWPGRLEKQ